MPTTSSPASTSASRRSRLDWTKWRSRPRTIIFRTPNVPSGLYYAQFAAPDGRVGYAPFVVRPRARRDEPRARRAADEHVAGLQLPGRRRQRLRRHVVRRSAERHGQPRHARTSRAACRRASTATTCRSCTGSTGRASPPSSSPTPTSTDRERRRAREALRPRRLRGARGVRDAARVRRHPALPRPRRESDVPLGEQLLLEGRARRPGAAEDRRSGATPAGPRRR